MKLDIKSYIILFLLVVSTVFFTIWYFNGDNLKNENKLLENKVIQIELQRDSLNKLKKNLEIEYLTVNNIIDSQEKKLISINIELDKSKKDLIIANTKISNLNNDLVKINSQIKSLKDKPIKRNNGDLLISLKNKLK